MASESKLKSYVPGGKCETTDNFQAALDYAGRMTQTNGPHVMEVLSYFLERMAESMVRGEPVTIPGFGLFVIRRPFGRIGARAKFRKPVMAFVPNFRLRVMMERECPPWLDLHDIWLRYSKRNYASATQRGKGHGGKFKCRDGTTPGEALRYMARRAQRASASRGLPSGAELFTS